jgi:tetratricopeptide (TPR) repeat protein
MRAVAVCLLPLGLAFAQHHESPPAGEKPVVLHKGLGIWRHAIRTKNPEAQKYFDQGLALMYGFNRYEALRSFRKATELDPGAAMAWWGIAMSQGPYVNMDGEPTYDIKGSCAAVDQGLKISGIDPRERAYLEAASKRCPDFAQPAAYVAAMRDLVQRYPDDLDAATLYADSLMIPNRWHWYTADGTPAEGQKEAERVLESVLRRWPDHPGANHMYIHAVESSPEPERAIASAQRLMGEVPAAGHLVHMPGHIWLVLGDWEMAAAVNERAAEVDRQYFAATNVTAGSYPMYYVHNLHFIAYARWMQGRRADGLKAADNMAEAIAPMAAVMPEMADAFLAMPVFARIRFGAWDEILKMPEPKKAFQLTGMFRHYARALAMSARGDRGEAAKEQAIFETGRKMVPAEAPWGTNNKASDVLAMASEILSARLAASPVEAVPHWQRAVDLENTLTYDEPPAWFYPVRESLGAALVRAGNAAEGEKVLREGIRKSPRNGRMLFALMESLKAQGKTEAAEMVRKEHEAAWSKADVQLNLAEL